MMPVAMPETRECPACGLDAPFQAAECPYCGYEFPVEKAGVRASAWLMAALMLLFALPLLAWLLRGLG